MLVVQWWALPSWRPPTQVRRLNRVWHSRSPRILLVGKKNHLSITSFFSEACTLCILSSNPAQEVKIEDECLNKIQPKDKKNLKPIRKLRSPGLTLWREVQRWWREARLRLAQVSAVLSAGTTYGSRRRGGSEAAGSGNVLFVSLSAAIDAGRGEELSCNWAAESRSNPKQAGKRRGVAITPRHTFCWIDD